MQEPTTRFIAMQGPCMATCSEESDEDESVVKAWAVKFAKRAAINRIIILASCLTYFLHVQ